MVPRALCWIRRDLRLADHSALASATSAAERVALAFVFDTNILDALVDRDDRRVSFIYGSLRELDRMLAARGSRLIVLHGDPIREIPAAAERLDAQEVHVARDYEPYAVHRDERVGRFLVEQGRRLVSVKDHVVFEGLEVCTREGRPFGVYTPYRNAWRARLTPDDLAPREPDLNRLWPADANWPTLRPLEQIGFEEAAMWLPAGEVAARERLDEFERRMDRYAAERDFPGLEATSGLSAHLRFGTLSVRQCFRRALAREGEGARVWADELIWREFYQMILATRPDVVDHAFKPEFDAIVWPGSDADFEAWAEGRTGYPIVDAAMRCLKATGWMHNRLRMICASFLVKDLLVDWRRGEAHFARYLLDFDLAQNNGGWQWCASTGADAQPHFRIFNPILQSRKFDPEGTFIREWCPELTGFDSRTIHWPAEAGPLEQLAAGCRLGDDYPWPIVDHFEQRRSALALLSAAVDTRKDTVPRSREEGSDRLG